MAFQKPVKNSVPTYTSDEVINTELKEVATRRRVSQDDPQPTPENVKNDLVGVALSGGGVRSGALGLGFIQGLYERRLLPFVDFLSTVSGGGYAGAYLSSISLASHNTSDIEKSSDSNSEGRTTTKRSRTTREEREFPIDSEANGRQSERIRKFVYGSQYLKESWKFANRYLIGLLLTWTVVISGLVAVCAGTAWCYRCLDARWVVSWLCAVGLESDLARAFVPAMVFGGLWLIAWTISYWRRGPRAHGTVARSLCRAMLLCIVLGFAALIGTGDINLPSFWGANSDGMHANNWKTLRNILLFTIAACLLPYLRPASLLRSGVNPQGATEKYFFFFATRALVLGVPLAIFAWFASENISGWNDRRSDLLTPSEIRTTNPKHPLWATLEQPESYAGRFVQSFLGRQFTAYLAATWSGKTVGCDFWNGADNSDEARRILRRLNSNKGLNGGLALPPSVAQEQKSSGVKLDPGKNSIVDYVDQHAQLAEDPSYDEYSFLYRCWLGGGYLLQKIVRSPEPDNAISKLAHNKQEREKLEWELAESVNKQLEKKNFYKLFIPAATVSPVLPGSLTGEKPKTQTPLMTAYLQLDAASAKKKSVTPVETIEDLFIEWRTAVLEARAHAQEVASQDPSVHSDPSRVSKTNLNEDLVKASMLTEEQWKRNVIAANRRLMAAFYGPGVVGSREIVYSKVCIHADQAERWWWFVAALTVFLVSSVLVDLNATSWHGFYCEQIGQYWIDSVPGLKNRIPLAQLETTDAGRPYHLITGCMNRIGFRKRRELTEPQAAFLFSKLFCGADVTGYEATKDWMGGDYTLEDAVAVSGAAVSPVRAQNPLVMLLLLLFNVRLGQWVDTPGRQPWLSWYASPFRVIFNMFQGTKKRSMQFVTDGGHVENLGIEPLLKRRCRLIVAVDAGEDGQYAYEDLARLIRRVRLIDGITLHSPGDPDRPLSMKSMKPKEGEKNVLSNTMLAEIRYPDADPEAPSYLIYMKSSLTDQAPLELQQLSDRTDFPHDPTSDQFLAPEQFDAYRLLGHHLVSTLAERIPSDISPQTSRMRQNAFVSKIVSRKPIKRPYVKISAEHAQCLKVVSDSNACNIERRSAARELMHYSIPPATLSSLIKLLTEVREAEVADGIADAIVSAESAAIPQLLGALAVDEPDTSDAPSLPLKFESVVRLVIPLERVLTNTPDHLSDSERVLVKVLESLLEQRTELTRPPRPWTKACCLIIETLTLIGRETQYDGNNHEKLERVLNRIVEQSPSNSPVRKSAEWAMSELM